MGELSIEEILKQGEQFFTEGKYEDAIKKFQKAILKDSKNAIACNSMVRNRKQI